MATKSYRQLNQSNIICGFDNISSTLDYEILILNAEENLDTTKNWIVKSIKLWTESLEN